MRHLSCLGYVDLEDPTFSDVRELMGSISGATLERPEFELTDDSGLTMHLAALFSPGIEPPKWCLTIWEGSEHLRLAPAEPTHRYVEYIYCACPIEIDEAYAVTQDDALQVVAAFLDGQPLDARFRWLHGGIRP